MPEASSQRKQSLQSLERGMAVIQTFSRERPALTLSDVARLTGTTRATARRILLTLEKLGYVRSSGRLFSLTPRVLALGWAYLSSLNLWEVAQPFMQELVEETGESCSAATLDLPDVVYVARIPTRGIMTVSLGVGSRLPAHATSTGRVLLAHLPPDELEGFLNDAPLEGFTQYTITDAEALIGELEQVRTQGWALVDQELDMGLRSIAAPIRCADGNTVAALNTSAFAPRASIAEFLERFLPALLRTTEAISGSMRRAAAGGPINDPLVTSPPRQRSRESAHLPA